MNPIRTAVEPEVISAFRAYEDQERQHNSRIGCLLVITLMPLGIPMDWYVYPEHFRLFLHLRLWSAIIAAGIWVLLGTNFGKRCSRILGMVIPMVPVFFIAWMIGRSEGFRSPYYAGLNLVLLAVGSVLRWTFLESLFAVSVVLTLYIATGLWHGGEVSHAILATNFFFILCMDIIVVVGTFFQHRARFREFLLRFELDRNKSMLEASNQKLLELDEAKSRFFANISHELRTPLTLLIAPLETLAGRFNLDPDSKSLLATMQANAMRLLKLINDLLDLVRLESGRMDVKHEPVRVEDLILGLASSVRQVAEGKQLRLETFVDPTLGTILSDRDKLEKVILNLVFNAIKFTPAGGLVELRAEKQDQEFVLKVSDTGVGISEKNLTYVFDRFWQADSSSRRRQQGVGIGLALVKELVTMQGGSVSVQSQEHKGTTFTVRLPCSSANPPGARNAGPERGNPSASDGWLENLYRRAELFPVVAGRAATLVLEPAKTNGSKPTLLVADDEPDMLRFLESELQTHYHVVGVPDGAQAVQKAGQILPDLILLDMMMPEKDGLQTCQEIKQQDPTRNIPVVLLTARADEETKLAALSAGASDFLTKPFSTTELHVRIKNLIATHEYQRKLSKQNQVLASTIDQLKETETQLVQSEKLASLGRMSAGIIHEINNPLNFATTGLYTLRKRNHLLARENRAEYDEILRDVEDGISRIKNIVSDLRTFTHPESQHEEAVDVEEAITTTLRFLAHQTRNGMRIERSFEPDQKICINKNRLIQVLLNLLQNSLDALQTKPPCDERPTIWIEGHIRAGKNLLVIRDNGPGIDGEHLDKIFDPFYTTKEVGKGMGLGLAICYRIVQEAGGRILVRTEPGNFCEFTLEFPLRNDNNTR